MNNPETEYLREIEEYKMLLRKLLVIEFIISIVGVSFVAVNMEHAANAVAVIAALFCIIMFVIAIKKRPNGNKSE